MKIFLSILLFIFFQSFANASTQQVVIGGTPGVNLTTASTTYLPVASNTIPGTPGTASNSFTTWPASGTISNFRVNLNGSPGGSTNYTFYVYNQNGVQSPNVLISGSSTSGTDNTDVYNVTAGDTINIQVVPSASAPTAVAATWSFIWTPTISNQTVLFGGSVNTTVVNNTFFAFYGNGNNNATNPRANIIFPCAGIVENLYATLSGSPGTGNSVIFTVNHNSSSSTVTTTISNSATTNNDLFVNTGHSITIAPGDTLNMNITTSGTPNAAQLSYGIVFIPTIPGQFIIGNFDGTTSLANTTAYYVISGRALSVATETPVQMVANAFQLQGIAAQTSSSPGASQTYTFNFRDTGATPTGATVVISGATQTFNVTNRLTYNVNNGDLINFQAIGSSGAGAQGEAGVTILGFIPPNPTTTVINNSVWNNSTLN